jgi:TetR/AcrR family transcriptional repressor of nem operon
MGPSRRERAAVADDTHPTRIALLEAGLVLAETASLAATSVEQVVRAAGVSKGTFYVHFADRTDYLAALHRAFYDRVNAQIAEAIATQSPGPERLRRGATAYLDACVRSRGTKAMLLDIRSEPTIAAQVRANNEATARIAAADFTTLGSTHPQDAARLFLAMVSEVALAELDRGRTQPNLRQALWQFIRPSS